MQREFSIPEAIPTRAPECEAWLRGRGGLRARILTDGALRLGPAEYARIARVETPVALAT